MSLEEDDSVMANGFETTTTNSDSPQDVTANPDGVYDYFDSNVFETKFCFFINNFIASHTVILTFRSYEQDWFQLKMEFGNPDTNPEAAGFSMLGFLHKVFDAVPDPDGEQVDDEARKAKVSDLVKISTCLYSDVELPQVLKLNNGKFYFNTEVNDDPDTHECAKILSEYVAAKFGSA